MAAPVGTVAEEIVGRQTECAALDAFLADSRAQGRAYVITAPAGMGKTTLWGWAVARARARGAIALVARPAESEAGLSFAGLTDLLSGVPDERLDGIPQLQRAALDAALLRAHPDRPPEQRLIGTALLSVLGALSGDADVVLAIDDIHWLDAPSIAAVEFALRRVTDRSVRAIFSVRSDEPEPALLARLARERRLERLELGALSVASLHRVLARELGRTFPRPALVRIAAASQGNPLHAIEIARTVGEQDIRTYLPAPDSLSSLVLSRVRSLPAGTRDALLRSAVLAKPDLSLVDADALAPAEEAGLVRIGSGREIEFAHPLYASAVYASASAARRRAVHRALADAVDDQEERARHLALATTAVDEQVAVEVASAARRARARGAPDNAAQLMELALRLTPPGRSALERTIELAEHLYTAGDFDRGASVLDRALPDFPAGDLRAGALLLLSELLYRLRGEEALAIAREALAVAADPIVRVRCHVRLAAWGVTSDLLVAAADIEHAAALLDASPREDPKLRAAVLLNRIRIDLFRGRGLDLAAAERALELEQTEPPRDVDERLVYMLGVWSRYVDDYARARRQFDDARQVAQDEGDDSSLVNILLNRMTVELWSGDWQAAEAVAVELEEIADQLALTNVARAWIAYADAHRGRLDDVLHAAATGDRRDPYLDMLYLRAQGIAELGAHRFQHADEHLARALDLVEASGVQEPAIWRIEGDAVEAALGAGDLERARALVVRFEERAERSRLPWSLAVSARCRGLVWAAEGDLERASECLARSRAAHLGCPVPFEAARTLLAHGRVLRRRKQRREARDALQEATMIFARLGADAWLRSAEEELQRIPVRRAPEQLSPTELRIARLAADGLSNRLIAERAFVSVKTVEANLKRAYRKLGISSRAQLARALDAIS